MLKRDFIAETERKPFSPLGHRSEPSWVLPSGFINDLAFVKGSTIFLYVANDVWRIITALYILFVVGIS